MSTAPGAVLERREAVHRLLRESEDLAIGQIREALRLTDHAASTALRTLIEEGSAVRVGNGAGSRYKAKLSATAATASTALPTISQLATDSLFGVIEERRYASVEELRQATGLSADEVLAGCGVLVREEKVYMEKRDRRSVYVLRRRR